MSYHYSMLYAFIFFKEWEQKMRFKEELKQRGNDSAPNCELFNRINIGQKSKIIIIKTSLTCHYKVSIIRKLNLKDISKAGTMCKTFLFNKFLLIFYFFICCIQVTPT